MNSSLILPERSEENIEQRQPSPSTCSVRSECLFTPSFVQLSDPLGSVSVKTMKRRRKERKGGGGSRSLTTGTSKVEPNMFPLQKRVGRGCNGVPDRKRGGTHKVGPIRLLFLLRFLLFLSCRAETGKVTRYQGGNYREL